MRRTTLIFSLALAAFLLAAPGARAQFSTPPPSTEVLDAEALKPPAGAGVALIEFEDLECPDCARANPLLEGAAAKYNIPWVRHDFPLPQHAWAFPAAVNARWFDTRSRKVGNEYRDEVFASQAAILDPDGLRQFTEKFAESRGLDLPSAIDPQGTLAALVKADYVLGLGIGVKHVPTIWVVTAGGEGVPFVEVVDRGQLYQMIEEAMRSVKAGSSESGAGSNTPPLKEKERMPLEPLGANPQVASLPAETGAGPALVKRPMTFEDLMRMKRLGETAVSPDGKWLAYSVTTVNLEQNTKTPELWIQAIGGPSPELQAPQPMAVAQPGDSGPQFAPDGERILFLSSRSGSQQIWLADFDPQTGATANAKKLTSISTGADNAIWSPDGNSVLFTSAVFPDCPAITTADFGSGDKCNADRDAALAASKMKAQIFTHLLYRHWNRYTGDKRSHLFLVSTETGALRDLTPNDPRDVPPFSLEGASCGCAFAPDSKELAFTENPDPEPATSVSAKIFTLDLTNPAANPVAVSTSKGGNFNPAYSPDGKYLAWRSQRRAGYESDRFRLVLYDRAAKTIRDLLPSFDNWVNEFAWDPDSASIYFVSGDGGIAPVFQAFLDGREFGRLSPLPAKQAEETEFEALSIGGEYEDLHPLRGTRTLLASFKSVRRPAEIFLLKDDPAMNIDYTQMGKMQWRDLREAGGMGIPVSRVQITHLNDDLLAALEVPEMESFWFAASDARQIQGFLIKPPGFDPTRKYPVKFLIHGGPQGAWGDAWSYRWNAELFAASGYVVVMINPRGSTGYGQAFVDAVNGDWGGKPFTDLMEGLDYAELRYPFIDKTRECALGASYGGYMANWVLGHNNRFQCIVSHDGMYNPESAYGSTEELWFNEWEFKGQPWEYYGKPDAENPYRKWSPALSAKNFKTPTLLIHGQLDYRLDVSEGFQLFTTLQRLKVPSKMLYFPDEGHWVLKPQNSQLWYKTVNDWVDEWTK
jgi:dipeptidyl aminopeptidase/acylaminoacyl peptidase/protein-disulfide isomerase